MSRAAPVTPIGCFAEDWRQHVHITRRIVRELARDPSLVPVLERALDSHAGKIRRRLARDAFVHTVAWKKRGSPLGCVVATHCSADLRLGTVVDYARVLGA